jgi:bud site selection protein 20
MGRNARKKGKSASCKGIGRRGGKTKTRIRDLDQIQADLASNEEFLKALDGADEEKVSHLYCVECSRFFQSQEILAEHKKSKAHKHRLRKLKDWPIEQS